MSRREVLGGEVSTCQMQQKMEVLPNATKNGSPAKCRKMEVLPNAGKWKSCPNAGKWKSCQMQANGSPVQMQSN